MSYRIGRVIYFYQYSCLCGCTQSGRRIAGYLLWYSLSVLSLLRSTSYVYPHFPQFLLKSILVLLYHVQNHRCTPSIYWMCWICQLNLLICRFVSCFLFVVTIRADTFRSPSRKPGFWLRERSDHWFFIVVSVFNRIFAIAYDALVLILTWVKTAGIMKSFSELGVKASLTTLLIRDGKIPR